MAADRQTDTQTHRHTNARDHNTFLVVYDSPEIYKGWRSKKLVTILAMNTAKQSLLQNVIFYDYLNLEIARHIALSDAQYLKLNIIYPDE